MNKSDWVTIIDVAKALNVDLSSREAWEVGAAVRDAYEVACGHPPLKILRRKTNGGGSHCFAIYPISFRPHIERAILAVPRARAAQPDMFSQKRGSA